MLTQSLSIHLFPDIDERGQGSGAREKTRGQGRRGDGEGDLRKNQFIKRLQQAATLRESALRLRVYILQLSSFPNH
jgi:Mg-chelatase subunit ChlD